MKIQVFINKNSFFVDLNNPIDISIPLKSGTDNPMAWYCAPPLFKAVENEHFIGDVNRGGSVNFRNIYFNPHGHGTHTECVGHISKDFITINQSLKTYFFICQVISIQPIEKENDLVVLLKDLKLKWDDSMHPEALAIRTIPNVENKLHKNYSNTNPPYLEAEIADFLIEKGIKHLLVDLPSVDRESDEGKLEMHHRFWKYPHNPRLEATITEFIYIPDEISDGTYLLNLQIASFENDASPSKPVLYKIRNS